MEKNRSNRHSRQAQNRSKLRTNKIVDRLTFNPKKHKQKKTRELRQKLQRRTPDDPPQCVLETSIKFGSFNVNGLDLEASWAVQELLRKHGFDVKITQFKY